MKQFTFAILLLPAMLAPVQAQVAKQANEHYQTKEQREDIARGLTSPGRETRQHPEKLIAAMQLKPGMTVADIGTGAGFMLPYLSNTVGPDGHVLAEDIHSDFLDDARKTVKQNNLANVQFVLGDETNPNLPESGVDRELMLEVYHHLDYPAKMLANLRKALREDGKLCIADFYKRPGAMPGGDAMQHIRLDEDGVIREVEENGFRLVSKSELIPNSQYIAIFEKQ
ncbi:MAG: methyltransferase domain-containing protein [Bryobacteraceae bacterium]